MSEGSLYDRELSALAIKQARGDMIEAIFISGHPILLLDEPTASLDATNREIVVNLIEEKKRTGVAVVAIVHDDEVRRAIADRTVDVTAFAAAA
jgi:alpha-D-ribose 1-methylphosphonate 5-triphosphate synthase subunit PhnL